MYICLFESVLYSIVMHVAYSPPGKQPLAVEVKVNNNKIGLSKFEGTSATCALTNTQFCQSTICNLVFKCVYKLNKSDNALVKALLASSAVYTSRMHSHWRRLLYVHGASLSLTSQ